VTSDIPAESSAWTSYNVLQVRLGIHNMTAICSSFLSTSHSTPQQPKVQQFLSDENI